MIEEYRRDLPASAEPQIPNTMSHALAPASLTTAPPTFTAPALKTKTAQVEAVAVEYLKQKGRRATSGELLVPILAKGIGVTGQMPSKTIASYLSTSKRFDNVAAFGGYGLVEWNGRRTAPSDDRAAIDNGQSTLIS
jgi:hypothetical protein